MNENLNLCEILKDVPKDTEFYCTLVGTVVFDGFSGPCYPIIVYSKATGLKIALTAKGTYHPIEDSECVLFPSKEQRDWSKFEVPKQKVKVVLHPFDRVLLRDEERESWKAELLTDILNGDYKYYAVAASWKMCIPYNEQTAHLIGTKDPCPINYDIEFSKEYKPAEQ